MNSEVYKFSDFTLSPAKRTLLKEGTELRLRDKDFDVLLFLVQNASQLCSFDAIIEGVWGETSVANSSVEKAIANIRKILADDAKKPRFIKTVWKKGYQFTGDVRRVEEKLLNELGTLPENIPSEKGEPANPSQRAGQARRPRHNYVLLILGIVFLAVVGLLWLKGREIWTSLRAETVFADDFSRDEIDPSRWRIKGRSVKPVDGILKVSVEETDNPGILRSEFFTVDPTKPITITSRMKVTYSQNIKDKVYFGGWFGLIPKSVNLEQIDILEDSDETNLTSFGVRYMNYDYESEDFDKDDPVQIDRNIKAEGFFLIKDGGRPGTMAGYREGKISERIEPTWGKWFEQKLVYHPADGRMIYFVDGEKKGEFNVGLLKAKDNQIRFEITPWGWWVNHSMEIDYIKVTQ